MKSKRSKACDISPATKKIVYARDNGRCIICGKRGNPNSHFIKRSQRRFRNTRECCYIVSRLPLSRGFWSKM